MADQSPLDLAHHMQCVGGEEGVGAGIDWCARKSETEYEYNIGCVHHHGCRTTVTTLQEKRVLSGVARVASCASRIGLNALLCPQPQHCGLVQ